MARTSILTGLSTGELVATVLCFIAVTFAALAWQHWQRRGGPYRIAALYVYPIKSCGGIALTSATYGRLGFRYDRQWMIVNAATGRMLTAREVPHLQQVQPVIDEDKQTMTCTFALDANFPALVVPLQPPTGADAQLRSVDLWNNMLEAALVSDEASAWFNRVAHWAHPGAAEESPVAAQQQYQLVTIVGVEQHARPLPPHYDASRVQDHIAAGAWSDGFPFLLASEASLADLNRRHCVPAGRNVEMLAFRPNIVVAGPGLKPWEEDHWRVVEIKRADNAASEAAAAAAATTDASAASENPQRFVASKPCSRCVLTTVVPSTGKRHPTGEPLLSLRAHRKILAEDVAAGMADEAFFGQNLVQLQSKGTMRVGDAIHVVEKMKSKHMFVRPRIPKNKDDAAKKEE